MQNAKPGAAILLLVLLLACLALPRASASFTSMYVYGDGVCATSDSTAEIDPLYYELRNCNGRVWVEVLWQWQGHAYSEAKNKSWFGHTSDIVVTETNSLVAPPDIGTSLYVIWCNNADFVNYSQRVNLPPYDSTDEPAWTAFINDSKDRHVAAVTNLFLKGARTILMPNAVDIAAVPNYNETPVADRAFIRARVSQFNTAFKTAMDNLPGSLASQYPAMPKLKIYYADTFTFFDQVLANPAAYGLQNPKPLNSPVYDLPSANKETGPGIDYVFWDDFHPTAKFQMQLAAFFQKIVLPVKTKSIALSGGNVQIEVANVPFERAGVVQGSVNLQPPWQQDFPIPKVPFVAGGSTTKTFSFAASGPNRFYRVGFPVVWTWP